MTSVGGATAIMAESLTKNVKKCSRQKADAESNEEDNSGDVTEMNQYLGSNCPFMHNYKIDVNSTSGKKKVPGLKPKKSSLL